MAKPFPVTLQVEEAALGPVIRRLSKLRGVISFNFDPPKANGHAKARASNGHAKGLMRKNFLDALADGKPHNKSDIDSYFEKNNLPTKTLRNAYGNCERGGVVRKAGKGLVQITAKGKEWLAAYGKAE